MIGNIHLNPKLYILKLLEQHFNAQAACGIMGNIDVETGGSFSYQQKQYNNGNGYGPFQFDFMKSYYFKYLE